MIQNAFVTYLWLNKVYHTTYFHDRIRAKIKSIKDKKWENRN